MNSNKFFHLLIIPLYFCQFLPTSDAISYDEPKAKEFWFYQVASLCSLDRLQAWKVAQVSELYPNITDIQVFYNNSNLVYTAYNPTENLIWMAFRRTEEIENMIEDIDIIQIDYEGCNGCAIHQGFYDAYLNVRDGLINSFKMLKEKHPNAKTAILGHSLGAAMSTLAFVDVSKEFGKIDYFYTFGSPRVGNKEFTDYVNNLEIICNKARITHYQDATPHLPFNFMGYYHVGHEVFYDEASLKYVICEEDLEDEKCSMQFGLFELSTHDHVNYMGFDHEVYQKTCQ